MDRFIPKAALDIVYAVKHAMEVITEERKKQRGKNMLPPRMGSCQYRVHKRSRRAHRAPRVSAEYQTTDMSRFIKLMQLHSASPIVLSDRDRKLVQEACADNLLNDNIRRKTIEQMTKKGGMVKDEVIEAMVVRLMGSQDSLDHQIHDIFRIDNFLPRKSPADLISVSPVLGPEAEQKAYKAMRPALILATKILLAPDMENFWNHLMYGIRVARPNHPDYMARSVLEDNLVTARKDYRDLLTLLSERIVFRWLPLGGENSSPDAMHVPSLSGVVSWAMGRDDLAKIVQSSYVPPPVEYSGYILLSYTHLLGLIHPSSFVYRSIANYANFQAYLAITLVHEISHALHRLCHRAWPEGFVTAADLRRYRSFEGHVPKALTGNMKIAFNARKLKEPFVYLTDFTNEIGWCFETAFLGGQLLRFWPKPDEGRIELRALLKEESFNYPHMASHVGSRWLRALFHRTAWDDFREHAKKLDYFSSFDVERYVGDQKRFVRVTYTADKHLSESAPWNDQIWRIEKLPETALCIKEGTHEFKGDPREWYVRIRQEDVAEALESGIWTEEQIVRTGAHSSCQGSLLKEVHAESSGS